jgi:hypothetical protein
MNSWRRIALLLPAVLLLASACSDGTGPKYPKPDDPAAPDSIPSTGSLVQRPFLYV